VRRTGILFPLNKVPVWKIKSDVENRVLIWILSLNQTLFTFVNLSGHSSGLESDE
jgi:hypothetical protein